MLFRSEMSIPMAPSSEIFIDDILKKSLIFKEKRLDLIGMESVFSLTLEPTVNL